MKKIINVLLITQLFWIHLSIHAQSYSSQQIDLAERMESIAINSPPELAYIQTSKDIYETGEDLWFKVYLLDAQTLIPSLLSKTLYLQLLNEYDKSPVWQEKYEIQNGSSNGRVYLSTELIEGHYLLAAYTSNSFFNDTTEFKAIKRIKIVTDISSKKVETAGTGDSSTLTSTSVKGNSIQFNTFPEGGDLVSGIQSKLAFKAVNKSGEPVDVKGTLFEDNIPLIEFRSSHAGMGSFSFTPDKNKKYFVRLTQPIDSTFLIPGILPEGMQMSLVSRDKESLSFKISQSKGLLESDFYIRVQCRGVVYGMTTGKLNREILIKIPLSLLPQGIAEVTLFNGDLVPVAERLVYINQDKKLCITAELSEKNYPQRGKAVLKIKVKDEKGQPVMANLGVTVFDKVYQNQRDSSNIFSHVYLSSQLKGRIYNPSFYFNSKNQKRDEDLDLLMLTQGWRKYIWSEDNLKKLNKEQQQIIFDGILGNLYIPGKKKSKIPKEQSFVVAYSPDIDSSNLFIPANTEGIFSVTADKFKKWEKNYVYLKPFGPNGSNLKIKLNDPFETINRLVILNEISYPIASLSEVKKTTPDSSYTAGSDVVRIKEVTIKGEKENLIRGKYMGTLDSLARLNIKTVTGNSSQDYVCLHGIWNCRNHTRFDPGSTKPVEGKRYYDNNGLGHVVLYSLPGQELTEEGLLEKFNISRVKAYNGNREFYKPNYDKEGNESIIPDFRNTLLWEPSVFTNTYGEATLSFFCSDINASFVGRIEGVGGDGLLGSAYFNFNIRKVKSTP